MTAQQRADVLLELDRERRAALARGDRRTAEERRRELERLAPLPV